jgi:S1-C subfamily serine protease
MITACRCLAICVAMLVAVCAVRASDDDEGFIGVQLKLSPTGQGLFIVQALDGSPAEMAGLKADDIILKADGKKVEGLQDFVTSVRDTKPGTTMVLTIQRGATEMEIKVKVGKKPPA